MEIMDVRTDPLFSERVNRGSSIDTNCPAIGFQASAKRPSADCVVGRWYTILVVRLAKKLQLQPDCFVVITGPGCGASWSVYKSMNFTRMYIHKNGR